MNQKTFNIELQVEQRLTGEYDVRFVSMQVASGTKVTKLEIDSVHDACAQVAKQLTGRYREGVLKESGVL